MRSDDDDDTGRKEDPQKACPSTTLLETWVIFVVYVPALANTFSEISHFTVCYLTVVVQPRTRAGALLEFTAVVIVIHAFRIYPQLDGILYN